MEKQFHIWGLVDNPFLPLPPQDEELLQKIFVGRKDEIDIILSRTNRAQGFFVFGMFGIGKSTLALEVLRKLKDSHKTAYIKFKKNFGLAGSIISKFESTNSRDIDPIDRLGKLIFSWHLKKPCVIVVDDLDKDADIGDMQKIILESRQIIELGCLVILLGHPFGVTAELSSSHDILYPVPLTNLSRLELIEMIKNNLAISRKETYAGDPLWPFEYQVAEILSNNIAEKNLTPRILNQACRMLLDHAAKEKIHTIDKNYFLRSWATIAESCIDSLRPEDKEYYRKILRANYLSEDTRGLIREIAGGEFAEFIEVRNTLDELIQQNILIETEIKGKKQILPNPIFGSMWR